MFDCPSESQPTQSLQQSAAFERALRACGAAPLRLDNGALVIRRRFGPLPLSMLARVPGPAVPLHLVALRQAGLRGPVLLSPDTAFEPAGLPVVPLMSPGSLATLDLSPPLETLRAGLHQKWRNRLKQAEAQGLRVTRQNLPAADNHWLLQAEAAQQQTRGYRHWPAALTCAFARENRGAAKLFTAVQGTTVVAGLLVLKHGASATYHIGHTTDTGRRLSAQTLLLWEAICWLKGKGIRQFELGLVDTEEGAGLARFKLGTGAQVRMLGGTWLCWAPLTPLVRPLQALDRRLMLSD